MRGSRRGRCTDARDGGSTHRDVAAEDPAERPAREGDREVRRRPVAAAALVARVVRPLAGGGDRRRLLVVQGHGQHMVQRRERRRADEVEDRERIPVLARGRDGGTWGERFPGRGRGGRSRADVEFASQWVMSPPGVATNWATWGCAPSSPSVSRPPPSYPWSSSSSRKRDVASSSTSGPSSSAGRASILRRFEARSLSLAMVPAIRPDWDAVSSSGFIFRAATAAGPGDSVGWRPGGAR